MRALAHAPDPAKGVSDSIKEKRKSMPELLIHLKTLFKYICISRRLSMYTYAGLSLNFN